jgi:riboflavin kinase/FMN adenylyltransferase
MSYYQGKVIKGQGRGKQLGFPTINLSGEDVLNCPEGVFAGWVSGEKKDCDLPALIHIGSAPTFNENEKRVEVHILKNNFPVLPNKLKFKLVSRIRSVKKFLQPELLINQMQKDKKEAFKILNL